MTYDGHMRRTTVFLPEDLERQLHAAARLTHRPQSELVREALTRYLQELRPRRPRSIGLGVSRDSAVTSENAKEWVRGEWDRGC
jgi:metal-responsive CopG/Arc/MetJ family transcriptional regulator